MHYGPNREQNQIPALNQRPRNVAGTLAAAAAQALNAIRPQFIAELKKLPHDPERAWRRALEKTKATGAFDGPGWRLFPARFFSEYVKPLALQDAAPNYWRTFAIRALTCPLWTPTTLAESEGVDPQRAVAMVAAYVHAEPNGLQ